MKQGISYLSWLLFIALMTYIFYIGLQHSRSDFLKGIKQEGRRIYQFIQRKL